MGKDSFSNGIRTWANKVSKLSHSAVVSSGSIERLAPDEPLPASVKKNTKESQRLLLQNEDNQLIELLQLDQTFWFNRQITENTNLSLSIG